jgi:glycine/D-amino acid oxidase-like deaminating enzyme
MEPGKKTVLIAGGGFAGLSVAYALRGSYNCVLVDPKT